MWKYLNRGISTPLAIAIILILSVGLGIFVLWQNSEIQKDELAIAEIVKSKEKIPAPEIKNDLESACLESGGSVANSLCCQSAEDFSNTCLIGACGCSPENSKEVKTCDCGPEKCFDGEICR